MSSHRERELRQMLADLQRSYMDAAKPIVDELVEIEMRKPPRPLIIPIEMPNEPPPYIRDLIADTQRRVIRKVYFGADN